MSQAGLLPTGCDQKQACTTRVLPNLTGLSIELRPRADIELRPLRPEDVTDRYVSGINDPVVARFLISAKSGRLNRDSVVEFVQSNWTASDAVLFGIFVDGVHCGNVRLYAVTAYHAQIGIAIFDPTLQRRGVGSAALGAVAAHAVSELGTQRIIAGIDHKNEASRRAFAAAGFRCVANDPVAEGSIWHYP